MLTRRLAEAEISEAVTIIRAGGVVAFPTETVYGLGGLATRSEAIRAIFAAKGRPSDNPLIVHVGGIEQLSQCVREVTPLARRLFERFAPGPLTVVMPKLGRICEEVTCGLDTVGVRIPNHRLALSLLRAIGEPIAAPSANRSGRPSGTDWRSVLEDLDGRIDAILCGESSSIGLESTVVDVSSGEPRVLRRGAITLEALQGMDPRFAMWEGKAMEMAMRSPGVRHPHYRPQAEVVLFEQAGELSESLRTLRRGDCGVLVSEVNREWEGFDFRGFGLVERCGTYEEYGHCLYGFFREADRRKLTHVYCQRVAKEGLGEAIADRLERARGKIGE